MNRPLEDSVLEYIALEEAIQQLNPFEMFIFMSVLSGTKQADLARSYGCDRQYISSCYRRGIEKLKTFFLLIEKAND